jgi:hypothetical protein
LEVAGADGVTSLTAATVAAAEAAVGGSDDGPLASPASMPPGSSEALAVLVSTGDAAGAWAVDAEGAGARFFPRPFTAAAP